MFNWDLPYRSHLVCYDTGRVFSYTSWRIRFLSLSFADTFYFTSFLWTDWPFKATSSESSRIQRYKEYPEEMTWQVHQAFAWCSQKLQKLMTWPADSEAAAASDAKAKAKPTPRGQLEVEEVKVLIFGWCFYMLFICSLFFICVSLLILLKSLCV